MRRRGDITNAGRPGLGESDDFFRDFEKSHRRFMGGALIAGLLFYLVIIAAVAAAVIVVVQAI